MTNDVKVYVISAAGCL